MCLRVVWTSKTVISGTVTTCFKCPFLNDPHADSSKLFKR